MTQFECMSRISKQGRTYANTLQEAMYTCNSSSSRQVAQEWYATAERPSVQHVHSTAKCRASCGLMHSPSFGLGKCLTRRWHVSVARHASWKDSMQAEGWSMRSRRNEMLGDSAKMNLQQQFEQSVAADRGGSTLQVCALCHGPTFFCQPLCRLSRPGMGALRAVQFCIFMKTAHALQ